VTAAEDRHAPIAPAWRELAALAVAMRPDWARPEWDTDSVRAALLAAHTAGWAFEKAAVELWRLLFDPEGEAADLRNTVRAERPFRVDGTGGRQAYEHERVALKARNEPPRQDAGTDDAPDGGP
jgi:hypothetical protein